MHIDMHTRLQLEAYAVAEICSWKDFISDIRTEAELSPTKATFRVYHSDNLLIPSTFKSPHKFWKQPNCFDLE